jgi:hypothetical protein
VVRKWPTGAFRDTDTGKPSYLRHLSPRVLKRYVEFLHRMRQMPDGTVREPDNWKLGFPKREAAESLMRHVMEFWLVTEDGETVNPKSERDPQDIEEVLCSIMFNAQCYLLELLKEREK